MKLNQVKSIVGWIIVLGHLSLGAVVFLAKDDVFTPDQKTSVLLVLAPVFSIYFVSVVRGFIASGADVSDGPYVNWNFVGITILLPAVQLIAVMYLILKYPSGIAADTDTLQRWLSGLEVFLGGSVGLVVENLFPKPA